MNHNLGESDIHTIPGLLNSSWHVVEHLLPLIDGYPVPGIPPAKWHWSEGEPGFTIERLRERKTALLDSYEFSGIVSERVFRLCHALRWHSFLSDSVTREKVRDICRHLASVFGCDQVVYLPSGFLKPEGAIGLMYEGGDVEAMVNWLLENCGPPAETFESILVEKDGRWSGDGYYIERVSLP